MAHQSDVSAESGCSRRSRDPRHALLPDGSNIACISRGALWPWCPLITLRSLDTLWSWIAPLPWNSDGNRRRPRFAWGAAGTWTPSVSLWTTWPPLSLPADQTRKSHQSLFSFHSSLSRNTIWAPESKRTLISSESFLTRKSRKPMHSLYTLFSRGSIYARKSSGSRKALIPFRSCKASVPRQSRPVWGPTWSYRAT